MCGIFGFINQKNVIGDDLLQISQLLKHRGPDDEGFLVWDEILTETFSGPDSQTTQKLIPADLRCKNVLLHRRLSIQDLSPKGHQPMTIDQSGLHIVFNGEIYNFKELALKHQLELRSGTDTEVVLRLYEKFGTDCFSMLRGMWALAILDLSRNKLILSRDRFGIKPLHYTKTTDGLIFSSEIKPMLHLDNSLASISQRSLLEYISFGATTDPTQTFFQGVSSVNPGTYLDVDLATASISEMRYYSLRSRLSKDKDDISFHQAFKHSISEHLVSDVAVGSCLSGGLDSSLIVSKAAQQYQGKFKTYTCTFPGEEIDESAYAMELGKKYASVDQIFNSPGASDFLDAIEKLVEIHERPIGSASIFAQFSVMQSASKDGAKVLLDGQGADEVFGGYYPYAGAFLLSKLKGGKLKGFLNEYKALKMNFNPNMKKAMARAAYYSLPSRIQNWIRKESRLGPNLLSAKYCSAAQKLVQPARGSSDFKELTLNSIEFGLYELLQYEDRNAMAFSIETRVPFLDHRLVEWALNSSPSDLIKRGWTKYPLRVELEQESLKRLAWRKDKLGFVAPQKRWMREQKEALKALMFSLEIPEIFDRSKLEDLVDSDLNSNEHLSEFWRILSLLIWMNKFKISIQ